MSGHIGKPSDHDDVPKELRKYRWLYRSPIVIDITANILIIVAILVFQAANIGNDKFASDKHC